MKIPRKDQREARTFEALYTLAIRHGLTDREAQCWAGCVLKGREIAEQAKRDGVTAAGRARIRKALREA